MTNPTDPQARALALQGFTHRGTRLVLAFAVFQMLQHFGYFVVARDPRLLMPHAVAYLHDLLLLMVLLLGFDFAHRLSPAWVGPAVRAVALTSLFGIGLLLASYPRFLREYLAFPVNVFGTDMATARVFFGEYLGVGALWPVAIALALGTAALILPLRISLPRRARLVLFVLLSVGATLTLPRSSPQPFIYGLQQEVMNTLFSKGRAVPSLKRPKSPSKAHSPHPSSPLVSAQELRADHLILIVLEGVTTEDFEEQFLARNDGFYARVKEHAACFRRYYTTNLDTYTSLIAMLTSVQVPYRAYAEASLYAAVNEASNLVSSLRAQGFQTLFISTYANQPFVPTRNEWDRVMDRSNLPSLDTWLSVGTSRMEAATEDRAALPTILNFVAASRRSLVLHELVYGHSPAWQATTGRTQLEYYDAYLTDLLQGLTAAQLASRTMLVVVSDHGNRAKASDAENYRVPLLVVGDGVHPRADDDFRTHLDLQEIIAHYLAGAPLPPSRAQILVVGSSDRWVYGKILGTGEHLFIDDRTGRVLSRHGDCDPFELYRDFQAALDEFGGRFGKRTVSDFSR